MVESLMLTTARIVTFHRLRSLTNASGFFFERDGRLFLVTSRHVLIDEPSEHFPDRLKIELHTDLDNLATSVFFRYHFTETRRVSGARASTRVGGSMYR